MVWTALVCACALPWASSRGSSPPPGRAVPTAPPAAAIERAPDPPFVLANVPLPEQPGRSFQVQVTPCEDAEGCAIEVALRSADRVVALHVLPWAKAVSEPAFRPSQPEWGVGDPLDPQPLNAAVTGDGSGFIATIARPVALGHGVAGLLVDQVNGREPLRRAHHLLVAREDALELGWSYTEEPGTWSSTAVVTLEPGREGVAFFSGTRLAGMEPEAADALEAELLGWSVVDRKLRVSSLYGSLHAVVLGPIKGLARALALRDQSQACLGRFAILSSASLPEVKLKGTLLVQLGVSPEAAQRTLAAARSCAPKTPGRTYALE